MQHLFVQIFIQLAFLFAALPAYALELRYPDIPGFGKLNDVAGSAGLEQIINFLFYGALWLAGLLAFAALLYAGFLLAVSAGSPMRKVEAKQRMAGIVLGVLILLAAYGVLRTINPELVILRNQSFAICSDKGGPIPCPALDIAGLPRGSGSSSSSSTTTSINSGMFHVCLYELKHKTADGTEALPPALDPSDSRISGCNDKLTKSITWLQDMPSSLGGNWNDRIGVAILVGNGVFTFYSNPNFAEGTTKDAWVEVGVKSGKLEYCQNQRDEQESSEDCMPELLAVTQNAANQTAGVPVYLVWFKDLQKSVAATDAWGGGATPGDSADISSIHLEPIAYPADFTPLDYAIPYMNPDVPYNIDSILLYVKAHWPDSPIDSRWQTVVSAAKAAGISPLFALTVWTEEGGTGAPSVIPTCANCFYSEFGCFPSLPLRVFSFDEALACFINFTQAHSSNFAAWISWMCGPNQELICKNNPNFIRNLKSVYNTFVIPGSTGEVAPISPPIVNSVK